MKEYTLKYQLGVFGSFEDITPSTDSVKYLLDAFGYLGLIPSVYDEIEIPPGMSTIVLGQGGPGMISLNSADDVWHIEFRKKRIDIIKSHDKINGDIGESSLFVDEAIEIMKRINERFSHKFHRLTLISRRFLGMLSPENMDSMGTKLFNPIGFYQGRELTEWSSRLVSRVESNFRDNEVLNVISSVSRSVLPLNDEGSIVPLTGIEINFDINTFQGNTEYRFALEDVSAFLNATAGLDHNLITQYRKQLL